jgi:hypothetical protein
MPKLGSYAPDLPIAAFSHHDAQLGVILLVAENGDISRHCSPPVQIYASSPSLQGFIPGMSLNVNVVFPGVFITGVGEQVGQLTIIGEQDQSFTVQIQAAYWIETTRKRHQVTHCAKTV